jgi:hypothetical protein
MYNLNVASFPQVSFIEKQWSLDERLRRVVIPNLIGNRNALVEFLGCIKIPAWAGMTSDFIICYV